MTQVWAHRGASGYAPENTLAAFELAVEQGANGVELDVQLTRDDAVVVIHDETLERTTDGHGWVADHSLDQLRALDASCGNVKFPLAVIPTLDEVLECLASSDLIVNIELKNDRMPYLGLEERVLEVVAAAKMTERVIVSSFNHYSLKRLQELDATLPLGALCSDRLYRPWRYAANLGVQALHPHMRFVTTKLVDRCHELGLAVNTWTVNDPEDIQRVSDLGADAVITNYPNLARSLVG